MEYEAYKTPAMDEREALESFAAEAMAYAVAEEAEMLCPDTYTVQPGDTYYTIANMLGITVYEISSLNPYVDPNALQIGQQLCIPMRTQPMTSDYMEEAAEVNATPRLGTFPAAERPMQPAAQAPAPMQTPAPAETQAPAQISAPAQPSACPQNCTQLALPSGWDCSNILIRYGISYRALESANPGENLLMLRPGQTLCIPPNGTRGPLGSQGTPSHTIERQDTLESIARRYRTTMALIFRENPAMAPDDFVVGRVICIPQ